jgi:chaperonin GroEL
MKEVNLNPKQRLQTGLNKVADAVKLTIGPAGRNVAVGHIISNDGGTIAQQITLKDKIEDIGAGIIKDVIKKTSDKVGGGRTASAILTQAIVTEGLKQVQFGANLNALKEGMEEARHDITKNLIKNSKKVTEQAQLEQVATISTENEELGKTIGELVFKTGKDSIVTVEESQGLGVQTEVVSGLKFDRGWVSPYMVTNPERMEAELKDCAILITDKKISVYKDIYPLIEKIGQGKSLVVVAEDFDGDALHNSILMKLKGVFNLVAIKVPVIGKYELLEDLAISCGTQVVSDNSGITFDSVELGKAKKVIVGRESTVVMGVGDIKQHLESLKLQKENTDNLGQKDSLERRIASLAGGVAIIKVGAATDSELKYLKQKIEDGVNEAKRALEEGIVVGGDVAFIHAVKDLKPKSIETEQGLGYNIVIKAVEAPFRQIAINAGDSPDVLVDYLRNQDAETGYDATDKENGIVNMYKEGIIDALKVVRTVLENAISGAGMFLSIEATITDEVQDEN